MLLTLTTDVKRCQGKSALALFCKISVLNFRKNTAGGRENSNMEINKRQLTIYFRAVLCAGFLVLFVMGFILKWTLLTKMMCLSCALCFAIFTVTAIQEKKQAEEAEALSGKKKKKKQPEHPDRSKTVTPKKLK